MEAEFRRIPGVVATAVGYTGGRTVNPTYEQVCSDTTGHREAVLIEFDPKKISYEKLLGVFWSVHNPCQSNGQGVNIGEQYKSAIYTFGPAQEKAAKASKKALAKSGKVRGEIATLIAPASPFYLAEDSHQQYYEKRGLAPCRIR